MRNVPLHPGARALEDDCAVIEIGSETLILTHDAMAQGVHWRDDADPFDVAWRLVAANLSDLAAKGAVPIGVLLGYSLGENDVRFVEGLDAILREYDVPLLGGDTIASKGPATHGLTAIGRATHTPVPHRGNAKVGHNLYVTGTLGCALLGFEGDLEHAGAFNRPRPRLHEGRALAPFVSAMMDVSDGLLLDCWRMSYASNTSLQLHSKAIPVADQARLNECIRWGDDYQLLFTAPDDALLPVPATHIGEVCEAGKPALWVDGEAIAMNDSLGYQHRSES